MSGCQRLGGVDDRVSTRELGGDETALYQCLRGWIRCSMHFSKRVKLNVIGSEFYSM